MFLKTKRIDKDLGLQYLSSFEAMLAFQMALRKFFPSWRVLQPQDHNWSMYESTKSSEERAAGPTLIVKSGRWNIVIMQIISASDWKNNSK